MSTAKLQPTHDCLDELNFNLRTSFLYSDRYNNFYSSYLHITTDTFLFGYTFSNDFSQNCLHFSLSTETHNRRQLKVGYTYKETIKENGNSKPL